MVTLAGFCSFARDGRLRYHRSAIPREWVVTPRGPMFRNFVGVGPSAARGHVTRISLFHLIPAVIPLIPGTMFRNFGGVGRTPRGTMFRNSEGGGGGGVGR
jgi:hypothetical protein